MEDKLIQVVATATGLYGGRLRYRGQEFSVKESELGSWMVRKGDPLPPPLKPFVRSVAELANEVDPGQVVKVDGHPKQINTLSGMARRKALEEERVLSIKSARPVQPAQQKAAETEK